MSYSKTSVFFAPVLIVAFFAPSLFGVDRLAFRDVGHFYTPLYDYVAERCHDEWLPLWNPLDQTGMPLIGETTTAVLYPFRYLIFSLPISTESAMAWYVVLHLIIASMAARLLACWAGCRPFGAAIASVLYPLSGSVLFLYTNPPFLVGAAWLPIALGAMLVPESGSRRFRIIVAGMAMAMMMLGGDPQSALHVMIVVSVIGLARWIKRSSERIDGRVFLGVPMLAAVLSAPQLAASISWSQQSERLHSVESDSWTDPPQVGGKRNQAFQYSLPPWHLAEMVTPNPFGSFLPINQRFSRSWPGDGRAWTPSIYMGAVTFLALWIRLRFRRERFCGPWLVLCWLSFLLALGHFGLVWLVQSGTGGLRQYDSAMGGPYWILYQCLPGYDSFRYPTKWLPLFALAATLVTAQLCDRITDERQPAFGSRVATSALRLAVVVTGTLIGIQLYRWICFEQLILIGEPRDSWWGPLNVIRGLRQLTSSLCQTILVLVAVAWILRRLSQGTAKRSRWMMAAILVVCLDLGLSVHAMVHQVSNAEVNELMLASGRPAGMGQNRWMRTRTGSGWPTAWSQNSSQQRLLEVEASSRLAWFGRWHLADRAHVLNNMVSIRSRNATVFWQAVNQMTAKLDVDEQIRLWQSLRAWLAIEGTVHASNRVDTIDFNGRKLDLIDLSSRFLKREGDLCAYPAWQVSSEPLTAAVLVDRFQQDGFLLNEKGQREFGQQRPVIETKMAIQPSPVVDRQASERSDPKSHSFWDAKRLQQKPQSVVYQIKIKTPVLITRPTIQDGNWNARFTPIGSSGWSAERRRSSWQAADVHGVDGITQGVILPEGQWWLEFYYQPWWLNWTIAIVSIGWSGAVFCFILWRKDPVASVLDAPVPAADVSC